MGVRNYPNKPRVYLDMDGVLADFEAGAKIAGMDMGHFKRVAGAYLDLPVMAGAEKAVASIEKAGYLVFVLTKIPGSNPYAATEKLLWIRKHFPALFEHVIISPDKGAVGKLGDYLVDDKPEWANAHNFGGSVIKFENNWNDVFGLLGIAV